MQDRTAETIEAGELQRVAFAQHAQNGIELWAAGPRAAGVVDVDVSLGHASALERVRPPTIRQVERQPYRVEWLL